MKKFSTFNIVGVGNFLDDLLDDEKLVTVKPNAVSNAKKAD